VFRLKTSSSLWAGGVIAGFLVVVLLWTSAGRVTEVRTASVMRAPLVVLVVTNGKVEPASEAEVRARLDGRIVDIVEPGSSVSPGQVVLRIDDSTVQSDLARARSDRLAAREELRAAKSELVRAREHLRSDAALHEGGALTDAAFRETHARFEEARSHHAFLSKEVPLRIDALDLRIAELEAQTAAAAVSAPFGGTVYRRVAKAGQVVRAGDPVMWIADLEHLRVRANIDQVDLGRVRPGQRVRVSSNAFPGQSIDGRVDEVIPNVVRKESRAVSEALVSLERSSDGLVPGMTVDVEIVVAEIDDTLQVAGDAIFMEDGDAFAYRIDDGRLEHRAVKLGRSSARSVEILEGLREGDSVVVSPRTGLIDGGRVSVLGIE